MGFYRGTLITLLFLYTFSSWGQRIEIDRLDREFRGYYRDKKTYELSQKLIQLDSTYYVGHYYESKYRFFRASDKRGYQKAVKTLEKTIEVLEENYPRKLRRSTNISVYFYRYQIQRRYCELINHLQRSYQYIDKPYKSISVLQKLLKRDFVCNFGVNPHATFSWIYYRNRMYNQEKHPFLKESIEENLRVASLYADSIKIANRHNQRYLDNWWPNYAQDAEAKHYHFKDIIYGHLLQIDSAEYCSQQLMKLGRLSDNNYGNLQFIQAKFDLADEYYNTARERDNYKWKSIKEFDYMQSAIRIFQNDLPGAKSLVENSIDYLGTAPGFGWNNIALSRANYYAGDLTAAKDARDKAANFKEVHINSTWGEVDYERNTLLLEYLYHKQSINELQFQDKYYWLKPGTLFSIAKHYFKQENAHLLLTSELSADPERFLVQYNLFAVDNNLFFDEIWELIKHFNAQYFIKIFEEKKKVDQREGIHKYFDFFIAKFYLVDEEYEKAISIFEDILGEQSLSLDYEKLLIARVYEGLAMAYNELGNHKSSDKYLKKFYSTYPELVPFSELSMKFNLTIKNQELTEAQKSIVDEMKQGNIRWATQESRENWPEVLLTFIEEKKEVKARYQILSDNEVRYEGSISSRDYKEMGKSLSYKLFNIHLSPDQ